MAYVVATDDHQSRVTVLKLLGDRALGARDLDEVRRALAADPVASCMVAARVEDHGVGTRAQGGELWTMNDPHTSLCFYGANLIPLRGDRSDLTRFAARATRGPRLCSSVVGRSEFVLPIWDELAPNWGPAREVRPTQPLLAMQHASRVGADPEVRRVHISELDTYLPAAAAMFREEVGIDPCAGDGGRSYRRRIASLISAGRAFARFDGPTVVYKAEVGSLSPTVGQIQGVWVAPERRGDGVGAAGTAAVVAAIQAHGRIASLYVNEFNTSARAMYTRVGFHQVGTFATILID